MAQPKDSARDAEKRPARAAGVAGAPAARSTKGAPGSTGESGDKGVKGARGAPGAPGDKGDKGAKGPVGPVGEAGGPRGASGPAWLDMPEPAELVRNVVRAAVAVRPRTVIDPRAGYRYLGTLASRLIKLQGGLVLRAIVTTPDTTAEPAERTNMRSIG
jgi:hypothetical protein